MSESTSPGSKFNKLIVLPGIKMQFISTRNVKKLECLCECGNVVYVRPGDLRSGNVHSCGCYKRYLSTRSTNHSHGLSKHPLYRVWAAIKQRCYNENDAAYQHYGGRGIRMSKNWYYDAQKFILWGINNGWKQGLDIDRRDNNKGYTPANCRFISHLDNSNNTRANVFVTIESETITIAQAVRKHSDLPYKVVKSRIRDLNWSVNKALKEPVKNRKRA